MNDLEKARVDLADAQRYAEAAHRNYVDLLAFYPDVLAATERALCARGAARDAAEAILISTRALYPDLRRCWLDWRRFEVEREEYARVVAARQFVSHDPRVSHEPVPPQERAARLRKCKERVLVVPDARVAGLARRLRS